ncbi:MAG: lipase family protein [Acidimicrobiales bacterium]|jgi:pimeloyl-ACP methyl ester carboxylesterase
MANVNGTLHPESPDPPVSGRFFTRHRGLRNFLLVVLAVALIVIGVVINTRTKAIQRQKALAPFYDTSGLHTAGPLGQVVRSQPLGFPVENGTALRVLYRTQRSDGSRTFSSGMVFIPDNDAAGTPRPVVAWAHGTVGLGPQCAPSRSANPVLDISWVSTMLARGWVVTATDYAGLGTSGTSGYLVGDDEADDVLNSVRALQYIPSAHAGTSFAVWGHSQGGSSALFTAARAHAYAPELHLVATVASAPAAELAALLNQTYTSTISWIIGPEILTSWPATYAGLPVRAVLTSAGYSNYRRIAQKCITSAAVEGAIRTLVKQRIFSVNPLTVARWRTVTQDQTAPVLGPSQPLLVVVSLGDQVVLPDTNALYIKRACAAGSDLTSLWLAGIGHVELPGTIAPAVVNWLGDRFAGRPTAPTCNQPLPIAPAAS